MRGFGRQVQQPRLRPWQARTPYAVAGLVILFMVLGAALESIQRFRKAGSRQQITEDTVRGFVDAFSGWASANPERTCPTRLAELLPWTTRTQTRDIWESEYQWSCFRTRDGWRLRAWSLGEDQLIGTPDDIWSDR